MPKDRVFAPLFTAVDALIVGKWKQNNFTEVAPVALATMAIVGSAAAQQAPITHPGTMPAGMVANPN